MGIRLQLSVNLLFIQIVHTEIQNVIQLYRGCSTYMQVACKDTHPKLVAIIITPNILDQALSEAKASLEEIREEMQAWQAQHEATHKRLKTEQAVNSSLKV